jgi:hypothetical protein
MTAPTWLAEMAKVWFAACTFVKEAVSDIRSKK